VMDKFSRNEVASLAMIELDPMGRPRVMGLVTRGRLMSRYQQALLES
jgi:hypothetical protein